MAHSGTWDDVRQLHEVGSRPRGNAFSRLVAWVGRPWHARVTTAYFAILCSTTLVLNGTTPRVGQAVLRASSTNLNQLASRPWNVLVVSALLVSAANQLLQLLLVSLLVLAPLEHRIGPLRAVAAFVIGHVGATLVVAAALSIEVHLGLVSESIKRAIDVGFSYGVVCMVAASGYLFDGIRRAVWLGATALYVGLGALVDQDFSQWGHVVSFVLGALVAGPLLVRTATARHHRNVVPV
ncbi:MAG: putative rane protein [Acidimicrobiia bacterium]|nr:putative rane protein [Acidimicrobiia bacterium]